MSLRRKILSTAVAATLSLAGVIAIATPAAATQTFTLADCGPALNGQTFSVYSGNDMSIRFTTCNKSVAFYVGSTAAPTSGTSVTISGGIFAVVSSDPQYRIDGYSGGGALPDGTYQVFYRYNPSTPFDGTFTVNVSGSSPSPSPSTDSTSTVPATVEFTLEPTGGTVCSTTSETSTTGSWLSLPSANECTPPAATPDARLLGWATTPDFPVAIAQRQVDNGWGAYEIFNDEGQITAVFIPAGGATQVSSAATLYPIWKS